LDYRTIHRYPTASDQGVASAIALFQDVRAAIPGKALVLGEFGFANSAVSEDRSAQLEAQVVQGVRDAGGAGALKWMLNDFPLGANARENSLGMFRGDGTAKPVVASFRDLAVLAPSLPPTVAGPADYDIPDGHFFTQGTGRPADQDPSGFSVTNADGLRFWDAWQRMGTDSLGYPVSQRFTWNGTVTQVFEQGLLQGVPGGVGFVAMKSDARSASGFPMSAFVPEPPALAEVPLPAEPTATAILAPVTPAAPPTAAPVTPVVPP